MEKRTERIRFYKPPALDYDEITYVESLVEMVLDSGELTNGRFCRELEDMIAGIYNVKHVIVCSNATAGLWIVLKALKTKSVAVPSFTWKSLKEIIPPKVTWLDIDRSTWLPIVTGKENTEAYIINLTFGNVEDYSEIVPENKDLIYDAAQCFGAKFKDIGNATVFSLAPTKPFTSAEGGVILTNDDVLAEKMVELRNYYARMSEIHAIIGQVYLGKLGQVLSIRNEVWNYYRRQLPYTPQKIKFSTSYSIYGMLVNPEEREELIAEIDDKIEYKVYYEPLFRGLKNTEWVYQRILCIPSYASVNKRKVAEAILKGGKKIASSYSRV